MPTITLKHSGIQLTSNNIDELKDAQEIENDIFESSKTHCSLKESLNAWAQNRDPINDLGVEDFSDIKNSRYLAFMRTVDEQDIIREDNLNKFQKEIESFVSCYRDEDVYCVIPFDNGQRISVTTSTTY